MRHEVAPSRPFLVRKQRRAVGEATGHARAAQASRPRPGPTAPWPAPPAARPRVGQAAAAGGRRKAGARLPGRSGGAESRAGRAPFAVVSELRRVTGFRSLARGLRHILPAPRAAGTGAAWVAPGHGSQVGVRLPSALGLGEPPAEAAGVIGERLLSQGGHQQPWADLRPVETGQLCTADGASSPAESLCSSALAMGRGTEGEKRRRVRGAQGHLPSRSASRVCTAKPRTPAGRAPPGPAVAEQRGGLEGPRAAPGWGAVGLDGESHALACGTVPGGLGPQARLRALCRAPPLPADAPWGPRETPSPTEAARVTVPRPRLRRRRTVIGTLCSDKAHEPRTASSCGFRKHVSIVFHVTSWPRLEAPRTHSTPWSPRQRRSRRPRPRGPTALGSGSSARTA